MRSRCAASRKASKCATAGSRNPSAPKAMMSDCACWSGSAEAGGLDQRYYAAMASPKLAERAVAMARVAPDDKYVGLADPRCCARMSLPISICSTAKFPRPPNSNAAPGGGSRGIAVKGVDQIGRRLRLDRHRRHGAGDLDRFPRLLSALQPRHLDDRDIRRRHRHGARLRFHLGAARLRSRVAWQRRPQGGRAHRGAVQSAQGRDLQGAGGVRSPGRRDRWSAISSAPSTAPRSRARPSF